MNRWFALLLIGAAPSCSDWELQETPSGSTGGAPDPGPQPAADYPRALRVEANQIVDGSGDRLVLRGVNRSGSEYQCTKGLSVFDGDSDEDSVRAMKTWNVNAVRIPLNEACWLDISGAPQGQSGDAYKAEILAYVALLHRYAIVPILELHWAAPGDILPDRLQPLPNADHSPAFWADVAATFAEDDAVIFEAYNEPFPDRNRDTEAAWQCWRDGCVATLSNGGGETYQAAGMQALVDAIRGAGSRHVVLLGGVQYSNGLSRWLEYMPDDPAGQLGAAWHIYDNNACRAASCWNGAPADVIATVPVVVTELGQRDCAGAFIKPLMEWLDSQTTGYLAWSWNTGAQCIPATEDSEGVPWMLITDYDNPEPTSDYARTFRDHLVGLSPSTPP